MVYKLNCFIFVLFPFLRFQIGFTYSTHTSAFMVKCSVCVVVVRVTRATTEISYFEHIQTSGDDDFAEVLFCALCHFGN
jgi:hypothetical protein